MQIFVRNLTGRTMTVDIDGASSATVSDIKSLISHRTSIPVDEQRLMFAGKDLLDNLPFDTYGIQNESTLDLVIRLRGGEKKKRCQFALDATERCSNAALTMIGLCDKCQMRFCARHRLPEEHKCSSLDDFKKEAFDSNKSKLEREAIAAGTNLHNVAF